MDVRYTSKIQKHETSLAIGFRHYADSREYRSVRLNPYFDSDSDSSSWSSSDDGEPDLALVQGPVKLALSESEKLWKNGEYVVALELLMTVTEGVMKRMESAKNRYDESDGEMMNESTSVVIELLQRISALWLQYMVMFPYAVQDRMEWVQKLEVVETAYCKELYSDWLGPAIDAGNKGWGDVMNMLETYYKKEAQKQEGEDSSSAEKDVEEEEEEEEEAKEKETQNIARPKKKAKSSRMHGTLCACTARAHTLIELHDSDSDSDSDSEDDAHLARLGLRKRKRRESTDDVSKAGTDAGGGGPPKKKARADQLDEPKQVTEARIEYMKKKGYLREALYIMDRCGITAGKEAILISMGRSSDTVGFALSQMCKVEDLYDLAVTLIDSHPYAAFEIGAKAVCQAIADRGSHRFYVDDWGQHQVESKQPPDAVVRKLFDMMFLLTGVDTPTAIGASAPRMMSCSPVHHGLLQCIGIMTGDPTALMPELPRLVSSIVSRTGAITTNTTNNNSTTATGTAAAPASTTGSIPSATDDPAQPQKTLFPILALSQLCIQTMVTYFAAMGKDPLVNSVYLLNGDRASEIIQQRFALLSGAPAHVVRPIMLELAVSYLDLYVTSQTDTPWLYAYAQDIAPIALKRSPSAGRTLYMALPVALPSSQRSAVGVVAKNASVLYTGGEEILAVDLLLKLLKQFPQYGHYEYSHWVHKPVDWILRHYLGYDEPGDSNSVKPPDYCAHPHGIAVDLYGPLELPTLRPCFPRLSVDARIDILTRLIAAMPNVAEVQVQMMKYCLRGDRYLTADLPSPTIFGQAEDLSLNKDKGKEKQTEVDGQLASDSNNDTNLLLTPIQATKFKALRSKCVEQFTRVQHDMSANDTFAMALTYDEMEDYTNALKFLLHIKLNSQQNRNPMHVYRTHEYVNQITITVEDVTKRVTSIVKKMKHSEISEVVKFCIADDSETAPTPRTTNLPIRMSFFTDLAQLYAASASDGTSLGATTDTSTSKTTTTPLGEEVFKLGLHMLQKPRLWATDDKGKTRSQLVEKMLELSVQIGTKEDEAADGKGKGKAERSSKEKATLTTVPTSASLPTAVSLQGDSLSPSALGKQARANQVAAAYFAMNGNSCSNSSARANHTEVLNLSKGLHKIGCDQAAFKWATQAINGIMNPIGQPMYSSQGDMSGTTALVEWAIEFVLKQSKKNKQLALNWAMWLLKTRCARSDVDLLRTVTESKSSRYDKSPASNKTWPVLRKEVVEYLTTFNDEEKLLLATPPLPPSRGSSRSYTSSVHSNYRIDELQKILRSKLDVLGYMECHAEALELLLVCSNVWTPLLIKTVLASVPTTAQKQEAEVQRLLPDVVKKYLYQYSWRHTNNASAAQSHYSYLTHGQADQAKAFEEVCAFAEKISPQSAAQWNQLYTAITWVINEATHMPAKQPLYKRLVQRLSPLKEAFLSANEGQAFTAMVNYIKSLNHSRPLCIKLLDSLIQQ
eukprot:TRINITY_DN5046_c0_g1_i1.p1 TRINITY_DN5046_c0_g1~~TRINITY_DN5046_c0_g1_i1.p1  ORF type:complete len:1583 (-),score=307.48 TRINITY_DN5046_c0_g1_i1:41-4465(-)